MTLRVNSQNRFLNYFGRDRSFDSEDMLRTCSTPDDIRGIWDDHRSPRTVLDENLAFLSKRKAEWPTDFQNKCQRFFSRILEQDHLTPRQWRDSLREYQENIEKYISENKHTWKEVSTHLLKWLHMNMEPVYERITNAHLYGALTRAGVREMQQDPIYCVFKKECDTFSQMRIEEKDWDETPELFFDRWLNSYHEKKRRSFYKASVEKYSLENLRIQNECSYLAYFQTIQQEICRVEEIQFLEENQYAVYITQAYLDYICQDFEQHIDVYCENDDENFDAIDARIRCEHVLKFLHALHYEVKERKSDHPSTSHYEKLDPIFKGILPLLAQAFNFKFTVPEVDFFQENA